MPKYAKNKRPLTKPVIKAELSEGNKNLRIALVIIFLAIGVSCIAFGAMRFLGRHTGYTKIEAEKSVFSANFVLNYDIGASGVSASAEHRRVRSVYTEALNKYSMLFSSEDEYEGVKNIRYINTHPGEEIEVDSVLYAALSRMEKEAGRIHYMGITYEIYDALFSCEGDTYASELDPVKDEEFGSINKTACEFAADESSVSLELLGNNKLKLEVSEEYRKFAADFEFSRYIDLGIFTNAFVVDAICDELIEENLPLGAISSYDGFARNLDGRDKNYSFTFMAKHSDAVYPVCSATYNGNITTYTAKTYPTSTLDVFDFYLYADGKSAHRFIDKDTGEYKSALPELLLTSKKEDCVSLALRAYSALVSSSLNEAALEGVGAVWLDETTVRHQGEEIELSSPYSDEDVSFIIE